MLEPGTCQGQSGVFMSEPVLQPEKQVKVYGETDFSLSPSFKRTCQKCFILIIDIDDSTLCTCEMTALNSRSLRDSFPLG